MALITLRFYGLWHFYLGINHLSLEAENVDEALAQLEELGFQERLKTYAIPLDGKIQDHSLVLLNGVNLLKSGQTKLRDGDVLEVIPLIAGG